MEEIIFPNQIRVHRRLRGMPMQELADRLGVSLSAVSKIEKGYRRLNQEQLIQVAELLDCSLQDLYVNKTLSKMLFRLGNVSKKDVAKLTRLPDLKLSVPVCVISATIRA